jgi:hypothetical protein
MVLPRLDGEGRVLVGERPEQLGHKRLARHLAHGGKNEGIGDAPRLEMVRDHDGAVARVLVLGIASSGAGGCHAS